ncbi:hypothetical protein MTBBW1_820014 [Desulfamplus magnetovallimortis]|uniref:Uncharacterized protein n=1 Tax=Desulfamplus magnetovallimortis TaxID=1246637 RepID=A0A1W1HKL6_9BACT|nr:hypothetical protein [Desulfamplus magnetovallimortis]SLM32922.1 hypothetical protein MTBBW1_820014 [Desulfamplus magnetovallimortis]
MTNSKQITRFFKGKNRDSSDDNAPIVYMKHMTITLFSMMEWLIFLDYPFCPSLFSSFFYKK